MREAVKRSPIIFLAGAVLTIAYVVTTTLVGWEGWLIAVVGLSLGFAYSLISTPLILGPGLRHSAPIPNPAQLTFEVPGSSAGIRVSAGSSIVRMSRGRVADVWAPRHGNGSPHQGH